MDIYCALWLKYTFIRVPTELQKYEVNLIWLRCRLREFGKPISWSFHEGFCKALIFIKFIAQTLSLLKELRNWCYILFACGHYFVQYGFIYVCIFHLFFWKTRLSSFSIFSAFCLFYVLNSIWSIIQVLFLFFPHLIRMIC